jgi:ModE molybdate transport repressor domain/molybdenum-pterin binding domain
MKKQAQNDIQLHGSLWMTAGEENFGGLGRIHLLSKIAEYGSITQAAKSMKMSYKAAWDAVDMMNNLAGEALVERAVGGKGGGGTQLTERGERLIKNFEIITEEHQRFIEQLNRQVNGIADDLLMIARVGMKTSARNQFLGKVTALKKGEINDEITLRIFGKHLIKVVITHESSEELKIAKDSEVFGLIKASSMRICRNVSADAAQENQLIGTVSRIHAGKTRCEVILDLPENGTVVANIAKELCDALELIEGDAAVAVFNPSDVIIGVPV